jgi:uncharacterized protein YigE (DUF2233 family)
MIPTKTPRLAWFLLGFLPVVVCGTILGAKVIPVVAPPTFTPTPSPTATVTNTPTPVDIPTFTPMPTASPVPASTPTPTASTVPDTGWELLQSGLERRVLNLFNDDGRHVEQIYLLRLDPSFFQFDIAYDEKAKSLARWQTETNALVVVNGGYFRKENDTFIPNGLTIVNGQTIGSSFGDYAGMFVVSHYGSELRWLAQQPYNPNEPMFAALQSFPILVKPGGILGFPAESEDNKRARRTVIAQDNNGRILLLVTSKAYFTLHQLSRYLTNSDLDVDIAINLDGGKSTGILLARPSESIVPFSPLPVVITVHER